MNVGIPKERRPFENRVGLSPAGVQILCQNGHDVYIEHEAGQGAGFTDQEYERAGARVVYSAEEAYGRADLLLKVARPLDEEIDWLRADSIIAGLLHLASANQSKIDVLLEKKITSIAYEQIEMPDGTLPVLRPLSQIGGAMCAEVASRLLQNNYGGKGILLGGVPSVPPAEVAILGGGVFGTYAARSFLGAGAHVTVLDNDLEALQHFARHIPTAVTMMATERNLELVCSYSDVLVGAVLLPGQRAPILVTRELVRSMKPRSVIIDASIDEGGCVETSRPTTHELPSYLEEGVIHYCVPNMPGVVARTATHAFVNAAIAYILDIADLGVEGAIKKNPSLERAINTLAGEMVHLSRLTK
ncbi:MAG: alanine dehydrogenase [Anaerolineales bacterium]|nr:alanine dehydrogenase [Anaerolineales bacterium]